MMGQTKNATKIIGWLQGMFCDVRDVLRSLKEMAAKLSNLRKSISQKKHAQVSLLFGRKMEKQPILRSLYFEGKRRREKYALSK